MIPFKVHVYPASKIWNYNQVSFDLDSSIGCSHTFTCDIEEGKQASTHLFSNELSRFWHRLTTILFFFSYICPPQLASVSVGLSTGQVCQDISDRLRTDLWQCSLGERKKLAWSCYSSIHRTANLSFPSYYPFQLRIRVQATALEPQDNTKRSTFSMPSTVNPQYQEQIRCSSQKFPPKKQSQNSSYNKTRANISKLTAS